MPKVSVWLTSYNHEQFIGESIESILAQSYKDYELFIIDDCSSDNSWEIIQQYAQKDARIKAIRHSYNQGESGLQDKLAEMQGDYVAIAHCDDKWLPDKLEKQVDILEKNHSVAACFTLVDVINDEGDSLNDERHINYSIFEQTNRTRYEWLNYFFGKGNCLCHPSLLIRKKAYMQFGILTKGLHGLPDLCQWIRLCKKADIYIIPERLTKFRVHGDGSNTSGDNLQNINRVYTEEWLLLKEFADLIDSHEVTDVFPEAKQYIVQGEICEKYALAQILINHEKNSYKLFGLQLLYELFQEEAQEEKIKRLYGYTRKKFNQDKQKYDIFRVIPGTRRLQISVYLSGENGYSEEYKICTEAFVQQTGKFSVKIDLTNYEANMIKKLRIDLDEGKYRRFKLCSCKCVEDVEYKLINGIKQEGWDVFYTMDPQYEFEIKQKGWLCIEGYTEEILCGEVEQYHNVTTEQCKELQMKLTKMENYKNALEQEILQIKNTKIWRIRTKILRMLGR